MKERILIVSDDLAGESWRDALEEEGFDVTLTGDADEGYRRMVEGQFHSVVVNLDKAITAAGLIKRIRANDSLRQIPVLTVADWGTGQATIALAQGVDAFEPKPVEADRLVDVIEKLLRPTLVMTARASATNGNRTSCKKS